MTQSQHVAAHELALLESFVADCVQQLPKLPPTDTHDLPARATAYHSTCAAMLKQVLTVLSPVSPRVCGLLAQIWELTSLHFFVLLQATQTTLDERDTLQIKCRHIGRFYDQAVAQHTQRTQQYHDDMEGVRLETQNVRAELLKTRRKLNRQAVENARLRTTLNRMVESKERLISNDAATLTSLSAIENQHQDDLTHMGHAEEVACFGVSREELDGVETIHPVESYAQDLEHLFQGLFDKEREQMALLNEMDRFMNSNVVALLWRHGPDENHSKFLQQMLNRKTRYTQTEVVEIGGGVIAEVDEFFGEDEEDGDNDSDAEGESSRVERSVSGETGTATIMTKKRIIPMSLRTQLTTRPRIQGVLEKDHLSRVILRLLLEKMEADSVLLRSQQPRLILHRFMKEFFLVRYGIAPLAEYHMMEIVKSCIYYHEKGELMPLLLPLSEDLPTISPDGARISLFMRLCELVAIDWRRDAPIPPTGNLLVCALNAIVDLVSDVIELDPALPAVKDVLAVGNDWYCDADLACTLLSHHLAYLPHTRIANVHAQFQAASRVPVDVLLLLFASLWLEHDQELTAKLHRGFRAHHRASIVPVTADNSTSSTSAFIRIWSSLPDEPLSTLDLSALESTFRSLLELRHPQEQRRRSSTRRQTINQTLPPALTSAANTSSTICGINEKEFVYQTLQVLRQRRTGRGIRTNGRSVFNTSMRHLGAQGKELNQEQLQIPLEDLKPGL
ncbi:hypothetical protein Poli38472_010269 [Pythium oligandrum]|uniref:Uncharacterized protein n=1 Tax=Pythium oligandrum TaxID=41045 RepID=A0A8K1FCU4_PYTOL|nr:hypothetical protein Poli38472_010269 [Pythium oligandrum]|eukprot:TMW58710.1 hypothetical protein Poli38472_010269 [Pythium oligandrum]